MLANVLVIRAKIVCLCFSACCGVILPQEEKKKKKRSFRVLAICYFLLGMELHKW